MNAFRQSLIERFDGAGDAVRDRDAVRLRLADDAQPDAGLAVRTQRAGRGGGVEDDGGDIAQPHLVVDLDRLEILRPRQLGNGAHGDVLIGAVDRAGRGVEGEGGDGVADIGDGEAEACELERIDVDLEGCLARAVDLHLGDARHRGQALGNDVLDDLAELGHAVPARGDGELDDGLRIGIGLEDHRIVGGVRQGAADAAQRVAHVGGSDIEIGAFGEFEGDAALPGRGLRGDAGNALHPRHGALDHGRDFAVDGLGGGAGEAGGHGEHRLLDAGQLAHLDGDQGREAGDADQRVDDDGQHRAAHEQRRQQPALFVLARDRHEMLIL